MGNRISFVQSASSYKNVEIVHVQIEADRASALELLALGTRSVMETLSISLYEYLEALMEAKEAPLSERVIFDTSYISRQKNEEAVKSD